MNMIMISLFYKIFDQILYYKLDFTVLFCITMKLFLIKEFSFICTCIFKIKSLRFLIKGYASILVPVLM